MSGHGPNAPHLRPEELVGALHDRAGESVPHDFNKCHCDQWGRCLVHCPTCTCMADAERTANIPKRQD